MNFGVNFDPKVAQMRRSLAFHHLSPPANIPPDMRGTQAPSSSNSPSSIGELFEEIRTQTNRLSNPLSAEDQTVQSMPDVSPTKWHLAHTSWFFETFLLKRLVPDYVVFDPSYEVLFNSYYNAVGDQFPRARRGVLSRPGVDEVLRHRAHVDSAMGSLLRSASAEVEQLTELGLHHEQQHQELLITDIKHVLGQNPLDPVYVGPDESNATSSSSALSLGFVEFEGGTVEVGTNGPEFHYDNEGPRHRTLVADFELATRPINNREVIEFIEAGGYSDPLLWLSDGWTFRTSTQLELPLYWRREGSDFSHFSLNGRLPIDPEETACHLTYFEADAIARFMGARLPTEQEWECAASRQRHQQAQFDQGAIRPGRPAGTRKSGELAQMLGGVWEWTQSQYVPYPGYVAPTGAVGEYNGKFMHNQMVLRGGSCATPDSHVRKTYRNFFPSSAQWQFTGARLARGNNTP